MKSINRSSNRQIKATVLKPIRLVGVCVTGAVIALFVIHWTAAKKEEWFSIERSSNNKVSAASIAERSKVGNHQEAIASGKIFKTEKSKDDETKAEMMKRSATPDELILGMSRNELDGFHKRQALSVSKELSNSKTKVELPPSDDVLTVLTLHELDELHKQQTISLTRESLEFIQTTGDGANDARHAVISQDELDLIHRGQDIQSMSANDLVELPPISTENEPRSLTVGQLDKMISRQQLAAEFNEVDDTKPIILPPSSDGPHTLTNWELIELHSQQE